MNVNFFGLFFRALFRALATALFAPWRLIGEVYNAYAKGSRYMLIEWLYLGATAVSLGYVVHTWQHEGFGMAVFAWVMLALTVLVFLDVASQMIAKIPDDGPAGELFGWLKWAPAGRAIPNPRTAASQHGKNYVRGAAVLDGAAVAAEQAASGENLALNIKLGGVAIPYKSEAEHFLISGKTGAGKTQAINAMLRVVRERGQAAIIADPAGGYCQRFGRECDYLLNPFDARSADWSPFLELEYEADAGMIAKAAIPDTNGSGKEWNNYAQTLFKELLLHLWKSGNHSVKELLRLATSATPKELYQLLKNTPAAAFVAPDNERMLGSVRSVMAAYIAAWEYLPDRGDFSVRQWVRAVDQGETDAWLYLTYMDNQLAMLRNLVSCWLELAIVEGLSLSERPERRIFYIMDELDSLGKVNSLRGGLTKLRKYGGVCVNGLQTIAQLRDTYGREEAQTLLSCMSTKLLLAAGDSETAEYFSREIGDQEFQRENRSKGQSARIGELASSSENISTEHRTERAVLASEITALPNLHGFLKPVGMPVMRITLEYRGMENLNPAFIRKENANG